MDQSDELLERYIMKKKLLIFNIIFIIVIILTSCGKFTLLYPSYYEVDVIYKNKLTNTSKFCAKRSDKIYYLSNEKDGINGIYQMDEDGSNVELLIECPDIRRITVYDDNIYYVGLEEHYKYKYGTEWAKYTIYKSNDFENGVKVKNSLNLLYDTCYDAGFLDDGLIIAYNGH